jgi:hypothetical protein
VPVPRPSWVWICTTAGLTALATSATGSVPLDATTGVVPDGKLVELEAEGTEAAVLKLVR